MKNKVLLGAGLTACLAAWAAKDPVVMTVNGVDVPLSEFEYLFHKNSKQQLVPQSIDDYVGMFEIYKLKVAAAKAAGLDTTATFRKEMAQYRHELAKPYLTDSLFIKKAVDEYEERLKEEVEASHIMFFKTRNEDENRRLYARLDSIRTELLKGADFGEMALKYSADPSVKKNKGYLGYIPAGRYPYSFETAVWTLPQGEVSEIVESPVGYHLIIPGAHRQSKGKVEVSHIMTMVRPDASPEKQAEAKAQIDSLYAVVKANPHMFAQVASKHSADPGSARQGGKLPVFGPGEMVPEFEAVSYALAPGEIAEPVRSQYGWHIILKHRNVAGPDRAEAEELIAHYLTNPQDDRSKQMKKEQTKRLASKFKGSVDDKVLEEMIKKGKVNGLDSTFFADYDAAPLANRTIATVSGKKYTAKEFLQNAKGMIDLPADMVEFYLRNSLESFYSGKLEDAEANWLYANNADYRNLLNEYHDGTLLYEISVDKVWNKASSDKEGLQKYFEGHREDYKWKHPRVKGYLVQAVNDSVATLAKDLLLASPAENYSDVLKNQFNGSVTIEKVLVAQGQNPIVDEIYFGGAPSSKKGGKGKVSFLLDAHELSVPEDVEDVKGQVVSDYQNELEKEWVEQLRRDFPVKVNKKQLKKVK